MIDNEAAFLATILADPEADAPRLVYADYLEERGETARAEFIRNGIALHELGPPHKFANACPRAHLGGGHWRIEVGAQQAEYFQVGDRVDLGVISVLPNGTQKHYWRRGLLCKRIDQAADSHHFFNLYLVTDEKSKPDKPKQRLKLEKRQRELLTPDWLPASVREATVFGAASPEFVAAHLLWNRGFVVSVGCTWFDWYEHGYEILQTAPVTVVWLANWPVSTWRDDPSSPTGYVTRLLPRDGSRTRFQWQPVDMHAIHRDVVIRQLHGHWPMVKEWHLPLETSGEVQSTT